MDSCCNPKNTKGIIEMLKRMAKMTTIDENLIEEGIIFKSSIYEDDDCSVSMLVLSPGAQIKEHEHVNDSEAYLIVKTGELRMCEIGKSHSLKNPDKDEWMPVISIKHKQK